ncbi:MAG: MOSC domain-containing protein [Bacteroidota bacterium]
MKVIATNLAVKKSILWNGKKVSTGIYKYPTNRPIQLKKESVANDIIADRKVHGGIYKACYLYASDHYPYWKTIYPDLDWNWGMFGENLTVEGLCESDLRIGNIYTIGTAIIQITQPREPCFKLGIRFGNQEILKQFIVQDRSGTYVRILQEGMVEKGDQLELVEESINTLTTAQFFNLLYARKKDPLLVQCAIQNQALPAYKRERIKKFL